MVSPLNYTNLCFFWWSSESRSLKLSGDSAGDRVSMLFKSGSLPRKRAFCRNRLVWTELDASAPTSSLVLR